MLSRDGNNVIYSQKEQEEDRPSSVRTYNNADLAIRRLMKHLGNSVDKHWYYFVLKTYRVRYEELLVVIDHVAFNSMDERLQHYLANQYQKAAYLGP